MNTNRQLLEIAPGRLGEAITNQYVCEKFPGWAHNFTGSPFYTPAD